MEQTVNIVEHPDLAVVYPHGYFNGRMGEKIDSACTDLIGRGQSRIVINFQETETINTMGIANLVSVLEKVGNHRGVVCFSNLIPTNREILDVLDISRAVLIFDEEDEACRHLRDRAAPGETPTAPPTEVPPIAD